METDGFMQKKKGVVKSKNTPKRINKDNSLPEALIIGVFQWWKYKYPKSVVSTRPNALTTLNPQAKGSAKEK